MTNFNTLQQKALKIGEKNCRLFFTQTTPEVILIQPISHINMPFMETEIEYLAENSHTPFAMVAFEIINWTLELTPWYDPVILGKELVLTRSLITLNYVKEELVPWIQGEFGNLPIVIGGYSLAGIFSIFTSAMTQLFDGVVACSPSVWISHWDKFTTNRPTNAKFVYLSLGDREEFENKKVATVGDNIRLYHTKLQTQLGSQNTVLEWNKGKHFTHREIRTAKGFVWALNRYENNSFAQDDFFSKLIFPD